MNKQDLEDLIVAQCLAELARLHPEMKVLNTVEDLEQFVDNNFTKAQLREIYERVSVETIGEFVALAEESEGA